MRRWPVADEKSGPYSSVSLMEKGRRLMRAWWEGERTAIDGRRDLGGWGGREDDIRCDHSGWGRGAQICLCVVGAVGVACASCKVHYFHRLIVC
jgi:hypothetical protein